MSVGGPNAGPHDKAIERSHMARGRVGVATGRWVGSRFVERVEQRQHAGQQMPAQGVSTNVSLNVTECQGEGESLGRVPLIGETGTL